MKKIIPLLLTTVLLVSCGIKRPSSYEVYCDDMFENTERLKQLEVEVYEYNEAGDVIEKNNISFETDNAGKTIQAQPTAVKVKAHVKLSVESLAPMMAMFSMTATEAARVAAEHPYDYYQGWYPVTLTLEPGKTIKINIESNTDWSNIQP